MMIKKTHDLLGTQCTYQLAEKMLDGTRDPYLISNKPWIIIDAVNVKIRRGYADINNNTYVSQIQNGSEFKRKKINTRGCLKLRLPRNIWLRNFIIYTLSQNYSTNAITFVPFDILNFFNPNNTLWHYNYIVLKQFLIFCISKLKKDVLCTTWRYF